MRNSSSYLKMRVLGALEFAPGKTQQDRLKHVATMVFNDEDGISRQFTWKTIQTWLWRYKTLGIMSMQTRSRSDKGKRRKVSPEELLAAIEQVLPQFRTRNAPWRHIYRACIEKELIRKECVSQTSFYRIVHEYDLLKPDSEAQNKLRLAFSKQFANQMWQADTLVGPYISHGGAKVQARLICFIDDASRIVPHGEFFASDNIENLIKAFQSAIYKRGLPEQIYVDNGSNYASKEMTLVCSRLGIILSHTPVRDGAAKGKIERFFRTVRESFLIRQLDLSGLEALNRQFITWVEDEYNSQIHSTLQMKPIDRFGLDLSRIKFLPPSEANDELFFIEDTRNVRADNTFSFSNTRYEPPADFRNKQIYIRYDRHNPSRLVVYYKNQRIGVASRVDFIANDRMPGNK
jgi:putative transposase